MTVILWLVLLVVVLAIALAIVLRLRGGDDGTTDLEIVRVDFTPPPGSVLKGGEKIVAEVHYRYSKPARPLLFWAQIDGDTRSTYEPSTEILRPGTGTTTRWVALPGAGEVESIRFVAKDAKLTTRFEHRESVSFRYEDDPEMVRLKDDGVGARIVDVRFDPPPGSTVAAGTEVSVEVDYEIASERGVDLWVVPVTRLQGSYSPSESGIDGTGTAKRWFVIGVAGAIEDVVVSMTNVAGETVVEELVEAPYTFR